MTFSPADLMREREGVFMGRNYHCILVVIAIVLSIVLSACSGERRVNARNEDPSGDSSGGNSTRHLITVTGDADVKVVPDEIILTLGVETSDNDLEVAKKKNDEIMKKVLGLREKYRIKSEHVQTDFLSIRPRYRDRYESREIIGYIVDKTVVFIIKDIASFESLLSDVLKSGANYVHGIQFRTTELKKYREQARAIAIKAAQEKAQNLAKHLGKRIGDPSFIREDSTGWWYGYNSSWSRGMSQGQMSVSVPQDTADGDGAFALGQITINAKVTVSFELK
jgi:uncharacterized protein